MTHCYRPSTRDLKKRRQLQDFWLQSFTVRPEEIDVDPLDQEKWLEVRMKGIGGSDVPHLFALSKWSSPRQVYRSKIEPPRRFDRWTDSEDQVAYDSNSPSEAADTGSVKEDFVAWQFSRRTGLKTFSPATMFRGVSMVQASIDRLVLGEKAILEIKTVNAYAAGDWADEKVPPKVYYQVQAQLSAFPKEEGVFAYVIAEIGGQHYVIRKIERDEKVISAIEKEVERFWTKYVQQKLEPPVLIPGDLEDTNETLNPEVLTATKEQELLMDELFNMKEAIKVMKERADQLELALKDDLRDHARLEGESYYCNYSKTLKKEVDSKLLKDQDPTLFKKYLETQEVFNDLRFIEEQPESDFIKTKSSRRFTMGEVKKK